MREAAAGERWLDFCVALLCLAPLLAAFFGTGGAADAYGAGAGYKPTDAEATARYLALAQAGGRSLLLALMATAMAACIGIPAAWALAQRERPLFLLVICALPLALPASVAVSGWVRLFAPGAASSFFPTALPQRPANLGMSMQTERGLLFSTAGAALVLAFSLWPLIAFELYPGCRRARNESYDSALLSGSRIRAFFRIVIPQCAGELTAGALLTFLLAISDFSVSSLLLIKTLPIEIHDALTLGKTATAAWTALPLLVLVAMISIAFTRASRYRHAFGSPVQTASATGAAGPALWIALCGVGIGFVAPMLACGLGIPMQARAMSNTFGVGVDALGFSVRLAAAVALLSALAAVARLLLWPDTRTRALNASSLFLLTIPGSFLAAAVFSIQLSASSLADSFQWSRLAALIPAASLGLALLIRFIYVPMRLLDEGLNAIDRELLDSATLAGHSRTSVAISVVLPLLLPHLAASTALVFILALGEIPLADKLSPPGATTAMVWLFQQQHMGYDGQVFGLSLLMGGVCAGMLLLAGGSVALLRRLFHLARPAVMEVDVR